MMNTLQRILLIVILSSGIPAAAQTSEKIQMLSESALYVSGDLIRLQLLALNEAGIPVQEDRLIHTYLVDHSGGVILKRKFLITELDKSGFILLPSDLKTGMYKLVACQAGADSRTIIEFPVYNPNIFSSSVPPKNADTDKGILIELPENNLSAYTNADLQAGEVASLNLENPGQHGIMAAKVFDPQFDTPPLTGRIVARPVPLLIDDQIEFDYISNNPDSRISLYFVEQGYVQEFYLAEEADIMEKLPVQFGSGHLYAYQFDSQGNRLGEVPANVIRPDRIDFERMDDKVPFDAHVRQLLEKKRIRKFVEQVYRNNEKPVTSLMAEEFDTEPDRKVLLENFTGVVTLREALSNITPKTQVIKRNGTYEIRLSPENSGFRYGEGPLILMNGIPSFEMDSLFEMPANKVKSIELFISLEKLRRFGTFGRYGVVSIILDPNEENPWLAKAADWPEYSGVSDLVSEPVTIDGPDLRPSPYWEPAIRLRKESNETIRFRLSNVAGEYVFWNLIVLQDGTTFPSSRLLTVSPD